MIDVLRVTKFVIGCQVNKQDVNLQKVYHFVLKFERFDLSSNL